jgi:hypothetical protein
MAVPDFELSCVEVAVMVTVVFEVTVGAVKSPDDEMVPWLALHVTAELKLPVPATDEVHWLVCPDCTVVGEQVTVTDVIVELELLPPPPPQAGIVTRIPITIKHAEIRTALCSYRMSLAWTPVGNISGTKDRP